MSLLKLIAKDQEEEREFRAALHGRELRARHAAGALRVPRLESHMERMIARRRRGG